MYRLANIMGVRSIRHVAENSLLPTSIGLHWRTKRADQRLPLLCSLAIMQSRRIITGLRPALGGYIFGSKKHKNYSFKAIEKLCTFL